MLYEITTVSQGAEARVRSMLWAAYADALAFSRPARRRHVTRLAPWYRYFSQTMGTDIPEGFASDCTQLRMATSRTIGNEGFDTVAFSRIELPAWASYALTFDSEDKTAALSLARPKSLWWANTYPRWVWGDGIEAAVRVQPHVLASQEESDWMADVIANTICTHGHPEAIMAALFHAGCLEWCLRTGNPPSLDECRDIAVGIESALRIIEDRSPFRSWKGLWERHADMDFASCWQNTHREFLMLLDAVPPLNPEQDIDNWHIESGRLLDELSYSGRNGYQLAIIASALASVAPDAHSGVVIAANNLYTESIPVANMVGALLGACSPTGPPENVLDHVYLRNEGQRLAAVSRGEPVTSHPHPDTLAWNPPRSQVATLNMSEGRLRVEGLGAASPAGDIHWTPRKQHGWQWVRTDYGQTIFIKRRVKLKNTDSKGREVKKAAPITDKERLESRIADIHRNIQYLSRKKKTTSQAVVAESREVLAASATLVLEELGTMPSGQVELTKLADLAQERMISLDTDDGSPEIARNTLSALSRATSAIVQHSSGEKALPPRLVRMAVMSTITYCDYMLDLFKEYVRRQSEPASSKGASAIPLRIVR